MAQIINPTLSVLVRVALVRIALQADSYARLVFGADVERQIAGLAAVGDEVLAGVTGFL